MKETGGDKKYILFSVITFSTIVFTIFLVWFTGSLWGLFGLLVGLFFKEIMYDEYQVGEKEDEKTKDDHGV